MSPDELAKILSDNPYPGCVAARFTNAVRLDFDGLTLVYMADGWHFGDLLLESKLDHFDPIKPGDVFTEIRRILRVCFEFKVQRALNEAETFGTPDPVEYLTNLAVEKMLGILDVAALANARQAKIATNIAEAAARDMRIADLERDLTAKDDALKTANAALTRICEVIGAPVPVCPDDAVDAVTTLFGASEHAESRAKTAEQALKDTNLALLDVQAPRAYRLADNTERPIPDADRVRILGDRVRGEWREKERVSADHSERGKVIGDTHLALDDLKAPRLADGAPLSPAARIRALPR